MLAAESVQILQETPPAVLILCAYRGRSADRRWHDRTWWRRLEPGSLRAHRKLYRDYLANPRSFADCLALARTAAAACGPAPPPCLVIDQAWTEPPPPQLEETVPFAGVVTLDPAVPGALAAALPAATRGPAPPVVALVTCDPLGLGCGEIERAARALGGPVIVINGRRRVFRLDRAMARRLGWRRLLAATLALHRIIAGFLLCAGLVAAGLDRLRGRTGGVPSL